MRSRCTTEAGNGTTLFPRLQIQLVDGEVLQAGIHVDIVITANTFRIIKIPAIGRKTWLLNILATLRGRNDDLIGRAIEVVEVYFRVSDTKDVRIGFHCCNGFPVSGPSRTSYHGVRFLRDLAGFTAIDTRYPDIVGTTFVAQISQKLSICTELRTTLRHGTLMDRDGLTSRCWHNVNIVQEVERNELPVWTDVQAHPCSFRQVQIDGFNASMTAEAVSGGGGRVRRSVSKNE